MKTTKIEREDDIDSEIEYFQNWIVPTNTSTNLPSLKSLFVASNLESDHPKPIVSTFNRDDRLVDNFGAKVVSINDQKLLNAKSQHIDDTNQNNQTSKPKSDNKSNLEDDLRSEPEVISWSTNQLKFNETDKLNNSVFSNQKSKDYSGRKDVVFKSIFRAIKKYYLEEFKNYWSQNSIVINKKDKRDSFSKMWDFVEKLFTVKESNWVFHNLDKALLANYIGRISLPDYVMKTTGGYTVNKEVGLFYEWVYKYSRAKASQLFTSAPIQAMFSHFISSGGLQKMINNDKNLQKNIDIVIEKANELYRWFKTVNQTS